MRKIVKILVFCAFSIVCGNAMAQEAETSSDATVAQTEEAQTNTDVSAESDSSKNADEGSVQAAGDNAVANAQETSTDNAQAANTESRETGSSNVANGSDAAVVNTAAGSDTAEGDKTDVLTDAIIDKRLREVSTSLDTLKEDTFTTKSRLLLLREEVLQRSVSGSRIQIRHKNDMGGQYELVQLYYAIDREPVLAKQDISGDLGKLNDEVIFDRVLAPGAHQLQVLYVYKGRAWGVFRYMKDYTFRVESGYDFMIDEGKSAELIVTADEKGGVFTPYEERPSVKFEYKQYDLVQGAPEIESGKEAAVAGN